jgi:cytoskeletal protein RodZ
MANPLKEQREKLGKDIKDVARITRIKAGYLKAIEEEDFVKLPVEVYTKGYIREYAKYLGYPSDAAIAPYEAYLGEIKGGKDKEAPFRPVDNKPVEEIAEVPPVTLESRSLNGHFNKGTAQDRSLARRILVAAAVVAAVVVVYWMMPRGKDVPSVQNKVEPGVQYKMPEGVPPVQTPEISQEKAARSTPTGTANAPIAPPDKSGDKNEAVKKKRHNLDITAVDKTWIQIIIDGADKKEMLLNPGEKVNYEANQSIDVLIGNAAGVKLKFNGKEFEGLGEKGQVIKLSLPSTIPPLPQPSNSSNL